METRFTAVFFCLVFLAGCAAGPDYKSIDRKLCANNCADAVASISDQESRYGRNQKLLFLMDAAMVNMFCSDCDTANTYFHTAETLAEKLWTKSISKEAASFLWNEYTRPYAGEDFERAMINLFSAMSYIDANKTDEALVECRRLNALLSMYNEKYEAKNVYKEDAFARYLSGILYESTGSLDDAFIDYFHAYKLFEDYGRDYGTPMPPVLIEDLLRVAGRVNRMDEVRQAGCSSEGVSVLSYDKTRQLGRVVMVHFVGRAPRKIEASLVLPTPDGPVKMAFPEYEVTPPGCGDSTLFLESGTDRFSAAAHLVEDINKIAVKNLDDRKVRIMAKAVARTAAKQLMFHQVAKEADSQLLKVGLNFANTLIERADTRCWRTLPGEIHLAQMFVPPGDYKAYAAPCSSEKVLLEDIAVTAGQTVFVFCITHPTARNTL